MKTLKTKSTNDVEGCHCEEVEQLMLGRTPFVTRHGISIVIAAVVLLICLLSFTEGNVQRLIREMMEHIFWQVTLKSNNNAL